MTSTYRIGVTRGLWSGKKTLNVEISRYSLPMHWCHLLRLTLLPLYLLFFFILLMYVLISKKSAVNETLKSKTRVNINKSHHVSIYIISHLFLLLNVLVNCESLNTLNVVAFVIKPCQTFLLTQLAFKLQAKI